MRRRARDRLATDETMPDINADMRFVAERRDRNIRLRLAVSFDLALGDLHRPASIGILLRGLRRQIRPNLISRLSSLIASFSPLDFRCLGAAIRLASTICPDIGK